MNTKTLERSARILTTEELAKLPRELPASWTKAAGLLQDRRRELYAHLRRVRGEWDRGRQHI